MSALFRNKGWLTVAQLVRSWAPEVAAKRNPAWVEHDLMQVLIEDILNGRLDDAGPLTDGRRLGLRIITPEGQAGFLEGHQARDLIVPGGITSFVISRADMSFLRRHGGPLKLPRFFRRGGENVMPALVILAAMFDGSSRE